MSGCGPVALRQRAGYQALRVALCEIEVGETTERFGITVRRLSYTTWAVGDGPGGQVALTMSQAADHIEAAHPGIGARIASCQAVH